MNNDLHPNYRYMLSWAERAATERAGARILDFGCGSGEVVLAGRARGFDVFGAEIFTGESTSRAEVERRGLLGSVVREIRNGRLPFDESSFDLVVSNTVFEHVEDLEGAAAEIARVLRPGGRLVAFFPTAECLREGHLGIPLLHRFGKASRLRRPWTLLWTRLGLARHKDRTTAVAWVDRSLEWIDRYTVYRTRADVLRILGRRFRVVSLEEDLMGFRWTLLKPFLRIPWAAAASRELCRRWGGMMVVATRKESS